MTITRKTVADQIAARHQQLTREWCEHRHMNNDPIVEEVRRIRDDLAQKFNYDIHAIFADMRKRQEAEDTRPPLVSDARKWVEPQGDKLVLRK